jgi:hypothetical protein
MTYHTSSYLSLGPFENHNGPVYDFGKPPILNINFLNPFNNTKILILTRDVKDNAVMPA